MDWWEFPVKEELKQHTKRNRAILLIVLGAICFIVLCTYEIHRFTPEKWAREPFERKRIVSSMLRKYDFIGMSDDAVQALLGSSEGMTSFKLDRAEYDPDSILSYFIGIRYVDSLWIIFHLQDHHVTEIELNCT